MDTDDQKEKIDSFGKQSRKAVQQIHLDQYERPFSIFYLNNLNTTLLTLLLWEYRNHSTDWLNIFLEYVGFFHNANVFFGNCDE